MIADAVREIAADLRDLPGIAYAPDHPPEQVYDPPALLVYARAVTWLHETHRRTQGSTRQGRWTVAVDLLFTRGDLPETVERAMGYADLVPGALFAGYRRDRWGETVRELHEVRGELVPIAWGEEEALWFGWQWRLDTTIAEEVDVP